MPLAIDLRIHQGYPREFHSKMLLLIEVETPLQLINSKFSVNLLLNKKILLITQFRENPGFITRRWEVEVLKR